MLVSTKTGTIVKLVPGRERPAAEMSTLFETLEGGSLCGLIGLRFARLSRLAASARAETTDAADSQGTQELLVAGKDLENSRSVEHRFKA
jgi:hypothetical protein